MDKLQEIKSLVNAYKSIPNKTTMEITFCRIEWLINEIERLRDTRYFEITDLEIETFGLGDDFK